MFSGIHTRWSPQCPDLHTLMNFSQSYGALTTWLSWQGACVRASLCLCVCVCVCVCEGGGGVLTLN